MSDLDKARKWWLSLSEEESEKIRTAPWNWSIFRFNRIDDEDILNLWRMETAEKTAEIPENDTLTQLKVVREKLHSAWEKMEKDSNRIDMGFAINDLDTLIYNLSK